MARLTWDDVGERLYETGTSHGVLFPHKSDGTIDNGVAWNGLSSVKQSPDGADETPIYANNKKYNSMMSAENLKGNIEAYTYPDEFMECDGSKTVRPGVYLGQQERKQFSLVYSTNIGNDTEGIDYGEKMHFVYNAKVAPSERAYETINNDPNAILFSWAFTTTPMEVEVEGMKLKPTAYASVDLTKVDAATVKTLKDYVYGTDSEEPKMPTLAELIEMVPAAVTDPEQGGGE